MPLTLVLGPANSAKAGEVLGAYAAATPRGALLVVPTARDADHYARELVGSGGLLGSVLTFSGLVAEIARRTGFSARVLTERQRRRLIARTVAGARLDSLGASARSPGFARALGALLAELDRGLIAPERFAGALRRWASGETTREPYARELAALCLAYERECERVGRMGADRYAWRALDALREVPSRWGESPVFFYGFDDLHPLQRDAVETLSTAAGADVTVSLTMEAGRAALAARAATVGELAPLSGRVVSLEPGPDTYAPDSARALHHLERHLFEPGAGRVAAGTAVGLLEAGGERAEAELLAAEVLALRAAGIPPGEIVIVVRSPAVQGLAIERVFAAYGIPVALDRARPLHHVALGRALLALGRCAWDAQAGARDLLGYLRAGEQLSATVLDDVDAALRRAGLDTLEGAMALLSHRDEAAVHDALAAVSRLRGAEDPAREVAAQARRLLDARGGSAAPRRDAAAARDARACGAVLRAIDELAELEPRMEGAELLAELQGLSVEEVPEADPGAVLISDPLAIRARRFDAVLVAGLQEGAFPAPGAPEPFLSDEARLELAAASGLRLAIGGDALERERALFYAVVSRARRRLVLSFRSSDEEGNLSLPSPFVRDVAELLDEGWWGRRRRRLLADVVWSAGEAPTEHERARARVQAEAERAGALGHPDAAAHRLSPAALAHARHRDIVSAGALEAYAACPVRWLVERQLEPELLEPTAEPLARGSFMHAALERVLRELGETLSDASLPRALESLRRAVAELPGPLGDEEPPEVRDAARAAIQADLARYLRHEAGQGESAEPSARWRPLALEQRFGFSDEAGALPALELRDGERAVKVRGVIDRIDVDAAGRHAIVRDYKSGSVSQEHQGPRWSEGGQLQVALYMLAVRELLGLEPVAGLYQPLRGGELRPRGAYRRDVPGPGRLFAGDGCEPDELEALLDDARRRAVALAVALREGDVTPRPASCSRDGCRYPGICRRP